MTHRNIRSLSDGRRFALVSADLADDFTFDWFEPSNWGADASPVSVGGRGAAWFITSALGHWVLRKFYRGGLPGRFIKNSYLFLGRSRVRSIREYNLLLALHGQGLPSPYPIAAFYERRGLSYKAALILQRIEDVRALVLFQHTDDAPVWHKAGACIRRFHDHGVFHADLNCTNILIADKDHSVYLIDFDRGQLHTDSQPSAHWKKANLARLARSVRKNFTDVPAPVREMLLESLLQGYWADSPTHHQHGTP
jgi:3-deoxy-D-manno-octulosonic acid kinase